jgi:hypothetical protein
VGDDWFLHSDFSIRCFDAQWRANSALAIAGIIM